MSEKDWIATYFAPLATAPGAAGLRDDVAALSGAPQTLVTVDALVEGVHFLPADPLETVARKLVRVNVSDCLASGARPMDAVLTLGWPKGRAEADLAAFAQGFREELAFWGINLLGGDTVTHAGALFVSLTLTGRCTGDGPVRRSGGNAGDDVWLSGEIGAAKRGFDAIGAAEASEWAARYRAPALPDLAIAMLIGGHATASLDVSDGLLNDAESLANASKKRVEIDLDAVKFAGGAETEKEKLALSTWGDDYQCLFTASPESRVFIADWADSNGQTLSRIGALSDGEGLVVRACGNRINLPKTLGFEHD